MANILVLDDILDAVNLIKRVLELKGHTIIAFTEEEDAIKFIESNKVDLAILDMKLKKMTGVKVLEELKKREPSIRAIMLTGYPTIETAEKCLNLGADEYCVKPIDLGELEDMVEKVLKKS
jgi:DNA-binding NtrC family response regulator